MRSPDQQTNIAACLARISELEGKRRAALQLDCGSAIERAKVGRIVRRQQAVALTLARRGGQ